MISYNNTAINIDPMVLAERLTGETVKTSLDPIENDDHKIYPFETSWLGEDKSKTTIYILVENDGTYQAYDSDDAGSMAPAPFSYGNLTDLCRPTIPVEVSADIRVADWESFVEEFSIPEDYYFCNDTGEHEGELDTSAITAEVLLKHMHERYEDALTKKAGDLGFKNYQFSSLERDNDNIRFTVQAQVTNMKKLVREARKLAIESGFDDDCIPDGATGAFCLLGVTDTYIDPSPSFEYIDFSEQSVSSWDWDSENRRPSDKGNKFDSAFAPGR